MRKRFLSLWVENEIGVLARIAGLFSSRSYNLESLTVGVTEDPSISRMTIGLTSDDATLEQIIKQLNRTVEVIKVLDYSDLPKYCKEILLLKIYPCTEADKAEIMRMAQVYQGKTVSYGAMQVVVEFVDQESNNDRLIQLFADRFSPRVEVVRGGSVAIETD